MKMSKHVFAAFAIRNVTKLRSKRRKFRKSGLPRREHPTRAVQQIFQKRAILIVRSGAAHAKLPGSTYRSRLSTVTEHPPDERDAPMFEPHSTLYRSSRIVVERPPCPKCTTGMMLARIMPGSKGWDIRSFECRKCTYIHVITVATDPMKSESAGWLNADLSAPK
jgi:ribosomal protein S27AE